MLFWGLTALAAPLQVQVLTVSPGPELFSSMGHAAIAVEGGSFVQPTVIDLGRMAPDATIVGFLRGQVDYQAEAFPKEAWLAMASFGDRSVWSTSIPLTDPNALEAKLQAMLSPENRRYRYDWQNQNCATRIRDVIVDTQPGLRSRLQATPALLTARQEGARHLQPWTIPRFAWVFVTDRTLDAVENQYQAMRMPARLRQHLGLPAVKIIAKGRTVAQPPSSDLMWLIPGLVGAGVMAMAGVRTRGWLVAVVGVVLGLFGTSAWAVCAGADLTGIGLNPNLLIAGPHSFLLVSLGSSLTTGQPKFASLGLGLAVLATLGGLLGLAIGQDSWLAIIGFVPILWACAFVGLRGVSNGTRVRPV